MLLSQHRVSSSKTVRFRAPCGARCIGHAIRTWSAVCSAAPHSQFGEGARPHLCTDEWNDPGHKNTEFGGFLQYSAIQLWFVHSVARITSSARLSKRFHAAGTNGRLDLNLSWPASEEPLKKMCKI